MSQPFFVTGLPRSGMAWASVFLTTDTSICHPEPLKDFSSPTDIERLVSQRGHEQVGIADVQLAFFPDVLQKIGAPVVVLERPLNEAIDAIVQLNVPPETAVPYCNRVNKALDKVRALPFTRCVDAEQLKVMDVGRSVFWHCLRGKSFDEERFRMLRYMMIEANPVLTMEAYARNAAGLQALFADRVDHLGGVMH